MNELIRINYDGDVPTVCGRDLHEALEVETPYHKWFPRMCKYGFTENIDYAVTDKNVHNSNGGKQTIMEHYLTLDMAKQICMVQNNDKGKMFRLYFIEVEKRYREEQNDPQAIMARALRVADETLKKLRIENSVLTVDNQIMKPKADYFDQLVDRNLLTNFRDTAKQYGISQKQFVNFLLEKKYIYRDKKGKLMPYSDKNNGLFEVKECFNEKTHWSGTQTLITPKGRETFRLLCFS